MGDRRVKIVGVATLQVSHVQQWARAEDVTLTPVDTPPGANEWIFTMSGLADDLQEFLAADDLPRCKNCRLNVTEVVEEVVEEGVLLEAFCDELPLQGWVSAAEVQGLADDQLDWELVEDRTAPAPYVFRLQGGLEDITQLPNCTIKKKNPNGGRAQIRFRVYRRARTPAPPPPPPPRGPSASTGRAPSGAFRPSSRGPQRQALSTSRGSSQSRGTVELPLQPELLRFFGTDSKNVGALVMHFFKVSGLRVSAELAYKPPKLVLSSAFEDSDSDSGRAPGQHRQLPSFEIAKDSLADFRDSLLRAEVQVQGKKPSEVIKDKSAEFLASENQVSVFIPGLKKAAGAAGIGVKLQPSELFLRFSFAPHLPPVWDDAKLKDYCREKWQIDIYKLKKVNGVFVVTIDNRKTGDVKAAKRTLVEQKRVPQLKFSEQLPDVAGEAPSSPSSSKKLEKNQLLHRGSGGEAVVKRICSKKGVNIEFSKGSVGPAGAMVVTFSGANGKGLEEAKQILLRFDVCYQMRHPLEWTDEQVRDFLKNEGLDLYHYRLQQARNNPQFKQSERLIFFEKEVVIEKLSDWPEKECIVSFELLSHFSEFDPSAAAECTSVVLLRLPGDGAEAKIGKVKKAYERMGKLEVAVALPRSGSFNEGWAKKNLVVQSLHRIRSKFNTAYDLESLTWNMQESRLYLKGNADSVQDAVEEMQRHLQQIKVEELDVRAPKRGEDPAFKWHSATVKTVKSILEGPDTRHGLGHLYRVGWAVNKQTASIVLCWWEEDEENGVSDLLEKLKQQLRSFEAAYKEDVWQLAAIAQTLGEPFERVRERFSRSLGDSDVEKLCEEQGVAYAKLDQGTAVLTLCGEGEAIAAAQKAMTRRCQPAEQLKKEVTLPEHALRLLEHKRNQDQRKDLDRTHRSLDVEVTLDEPLVIRGEVRFVEEADFNIRRWLGQLRIASERVLLKPIQQAFLKSEPGMVILEKIFRETAAWASFVGQLGQQWQSDSKCLAKARLPNGTVVEVWSGDILANAQSTKGLVNSANPDLLKRQVSGIAGAIKRAGGEGLVGACDRISAARGPLPFCSVERTEAFNLSQHGFEHIFHAIPPTSTKKTQDMQETVQNILQAAAAAQTESVVLPMLGTGIYGWPIDTVSSLFLAGIVAWAGGSDPTGLQRIVVMDSNIEKCQHFAASLQAYDKETTELVWHEPPLPRNKWEWRDDLTWVTYDYDQAMDLDNLYQELLNSPTMSVTRMLLGDRQGVPSLSKHKEDGEQYARYNIEMQLDDAGNLNVQQRNRKSGFLRPVRQSVLVPEKAFEELPLYKEKWEAAKEGYDRLCAEREAGSAIPSGFDRWFTPLPPGSSSIGRSTGTSGSDAESLVLSALDEQHCEEAKAKLTTEINKAECKAEETFPGALKPSERAQSAHNDFQECMASRLDEDLPLAVTMEATGLDLSVKLTSLGKQNLEIGRLLLKSWIQERERAILAKQAEVQFPENWLSVDNEAEGLDFQPVAPDSLEFAEVVQLMRHETGLAPKETARQNLFTNRIVKVEQVIHRNLWRKYYRFRQLLDNPNEVWVKHGTGSTDPELVCDNGFNRSYSKPDSGNMWGQGIYTAESAKYSSDGYVRPTHNETHKQMLLCLFAAGKVFQPPPEEYGQKSERQTKEPPKGFDSIRGIVKRVGQDVDFALISYQDNQIYPFYRVTYE